MATLQELREQLDMIDKQIVELYEKRMRVCADVGKIKIDAGSKVFDEQREKEKITAVTSQVEDDFNKKGIEELYELLMSQSKKLQYQMMKIENRGTDYENK